MFFFAVTVTWFESSALQPLYTVHTPSILLQGTALLDEVLALLVLSLEVAWTSSSSAVIQLPVDHTCATVSAAPGP